ncbi:unnamed protein product [Scytosiphon promiscuus]
MTIWLLCQRDEPSCTRRGPSVTWCPIRESISGFHISLVPLNASVSSKRVALCVCLCIHWRELNKMLVSDSGGLGDMQSIFDGLKGKRFFTQLDLASGFHQIERDRRKRPFQNSFPRC